VGGSVVITPLKKDSLVQKIASNYPGRASMSPKLDLFITLLQMGKNGYRSLLTNQITCYNKLLDRLKSLSEIHGTRVIAANGISIAISLKPFENCLSDLKEIGSMLFTRNISGPRVVTCKGSKDIGQVQLNHFGCSSSVFEEPYLALAAAVGMEEFEIDKIISKLTDIFGKIKVEK